MIDVSKLRTGQIESIISWHSQIELKESIEPYLIIEKNNYWNFLLWHEEDIARLKNVKAEKIAKSKRNIDRYNQERNNSIEMIDDWIVKRLADYEIPQIGKLHSETPGMMIDRLSIMELKRYHMIEQTERNNVDETHINECKEKVEILTVQLNDLTESLSEVLRNLESGALRLKVFRQFKMYNDPKLNPQLYGQEKKNI